MTWELSSVCFQASCPAGSDPFIRWTYDGVGNRLSEARPTGTTSYTYNASDELTQAGATAYTYDQNGNELSAGSRTFAYDLANRLKTTTLASTTTTYTYDGDGKRLQASTGTQASKKTNFLWDVNQGLPQIALERDGNNSLRRRYSHGARRISQTSGNNTSYYLHDGLGSVTNLTSSSGATQWTWSYEPFGSIRTETKASGNQPDSLMRFTGEYSDPTGLYHLRARQYDPASGRFLSQDPFPATRWSSHSSAYTYTRNRPTAYVDPSGEFGLPGAVVGAVVGGVAGGVGAIAQGNTDIGSIATGVAAGAVVGAAIGALPLAAPLELGLIGAGADLAAQHVTGVGACGTNWGSVIGAGIGGAAGGVGAALVKTGGFAMGGSEWSREAIGAAAAFNKGLLPATLGTAIGRCQTTPIPAAIQISQNGK